MSDELSIKTTIPFSHLPPCPQVVHLTGPPELRADVGFGQVAYLRAMAGVSCFTRTKQVHIPHPPPRTPRETAGLIFPRWKAPSTGLLANAWYRIALRTCLWSRIFCFSCWASSGARQDIAYIRVRAPVAAKSFQMKSRPRRSDHERLQQTARGFLLYAVPGQPGSKPVAGACNSRP